MGASHEKLKTTIEAYPESMEASLEKLEVNQEIAEVTASACCPAGLGFQCTRNT
jgi:hypothetical protein